MTDINEMIQKVTDALHVSAINGYDQWEDDVDDIVFDLMSFNEDFEDVDEDELRLAVIGAVTKYQDD